MGNILDKIKAYKLAEIEYDKKISPQALLEQKAKDYAVPRGFATCLKKASAHGYALIGEIKKASPSRGLIRADFDPSALALAYQRGGACCLSVLTDAPSFQGAPEYLTLAREACDLPILRKDFIYDPYQVVQTRAWGGDCILIIMASVSDAQAQELETCAFEWGMDVILEVHNYCELERALKLKSSLIGINNRNLKTFEIDLNITSNLIGSIKGNHHVISESGLSTPTHLSRMAAIGVRCFLIGESLMRQKDVAAAVKILLANSVRV